MKCIYLVGKKKENWPLLFCADSSFLDNTTDIVEGENIENTLYMFLFKSDKQISLGI